MSGQVVLIGEYLGRIRLIRGDISISVYIPIRGYLGHYGGYLGRFCFLGDVLQVLVCRACFRYRGYLASLC